MATRATSAKQHPTIKEQFLLFFCCFFFFTQLQPHIDLFTTQEHTFFYSQTKECACGMKMRRIKNIYFTFWFSGIMHPSIRFISISIFIVLTLCASNRVMNLINRCSTAVTVLWLAEVSDFIDPITLDENGRVLRSRRCRTTDWKAVLRRPSWLHEPVIWLINGSWHELISSIDPSDFPFTGRTQREPSIKPRSGLCGISKSRRKTSRGWWMSQEWSSSLSGASSSSYHLGPFLLFWRSARNHFLKCKLSIEEMNSTHRQGKSHHDLCHC